MMEMLMTIESFDGNLPEPEINRGEYKDGLEDSCYH